MARSLLLACSITVALAASPRPASAQNAEGTPRARVHLETDAPELTLYEHGGFFGADRPICRAPCDRALEIGPGKRYFFAGDDIRPSGRFSLEGRGSDMTIHVEAGTRASPAGGIVAIVAGSASIVAASVLALIGTGMFAYEPPSTGPNPMFVGSAIAVTSGVGLVVFGTVFLATRRRTEVFISRLAPAPGGLGIRF